MFFLTEDKDYKTVASGLRRELKALGVNTPSYNQVLEAVAKSFGHSSWAALQVAQRKQPSPKAAAAEIAPEPAKVAETYEGEDVDLADDRDFKGYRLFKFEPPWTFVRGGFSLSPCRASGRRSRHRASLAED